MIKYLSVKGVMDKLQLKSKQTIYIILVNHILSPAAVELEGADMNEDGMINILDVIVLINIILSD